MKLESYEEHEHFPQWLGWLFIVALSAAVVAWAVILHLTIPDLPRKWNFGGSPDVPAESIYSSHLPPPPQQTPPEQLPSLPEGKPWAENRQPPQSIMLEKQP